MAFTELDKDDLAKVKKQERIVIAKKVGGLLRRDIDDAEREKAIGVAQLLAEDASIAVRETLSQELKDCSFLSKELIGTITGDIDKVSTPFLLLAEALDDEVLGDIVKECGEAAQLAIAKRDGLSEIISFMICDVAETAAVEGLMENETAEVSERSCHRVVDRFPEEGSLLEKMAARADLPIGVVERLIFKVSKKYTSYLTEKFKLADDYASYLIAQAERRAFITTLDQAPEAELLNYMKQLHGTKQLKSDRLLSFLQNGNLRVACSALAVLNNKSLDYVEAALANKGRSALAKMLDQAGFTSATSGVMLIAYDRLINGY